ncbi:hypothetical protein LJ754_10865 [Arthrobacter sp. zg-Y40]|uniref:hypothetical protein n=1 Tax=Arthrobacter sp. zg-Y40 TaxID=2886939 RepID=UPI001D1532C3|nr:hypothetical protein [Arthrobacter sp. zg-Y40]MCC3279650.1 hypothetical protein [Arthrobacter sp. zg-Y40]MDK1327398.1 hypothetical protein [Arthrobacter sp. zg-Y1143]
MLKHVAVTRTRTTTSRFTAQIAAISAACALVAGGVSAAEIGMLNAEPAPSPVIAEASA